MKKKKELKTTTLNKLLRTFYSSKHFNVDKNITHLNQYLWITQLLVKEKSQPFLAEVDNHYYFFFLAMQLVKHFNHTSHSYFFTASELTEFVSFFQMQKFVKQPVMSGKLTDLC